ncbi:MULTISPECIES: family 4 glycosyl hydrolase [unclassified Streptomyces]|uniref:family 4 glycosyl hydrolase n=1 Tax=Streptomyces sp. TN58 TaxID=234612 RepID=UPI00095039F9|nr:6-phospho-beta-glucosidase [Streptomyces sp. TN58]APU40315.1 6-phospho-beta-glucosidase [Streptomyces sp. TN58]
MKLAVVGGGSTYTPELVDGFARLRDTLPVSELVLIDPATERLEPVGALARRIFARQDHAGKITTTTDLDAGVAGADAVLLQLRVGGQAARLQDETWPLECGCVGQETTGAGGLAKALRTVPVVLDIAERVRRASPHAWIIDFTNPVGIVTRALLRAGHKAVGLCNVAIGLQRKFAALLELAPSDVHLDHVGLNHLTWELAVRRGGPDGEDMLPGLLAAHGEAVASDLRLPRTVLDRLGVVPSYYLRYFYSHDEVVRELGTKPSRAAEVAAMERELLRLYTDPALDEKPALLARRGGAFYSEAAVDLAAALLGGGGPEVQVVNTYNNGTLPFLPDDAVVEVQARVRAAGGDGPVPLPVPLPVPRLDPLFAGLIAHVSGYEDLALDAALRGGRERVFKALLAHPLIGQYDLAEGLADRLLAHNREHLPWA